MGPFPPGRTPDCPNNGNSLETPALATIIQHCSEGSRHHTKARKRNIKDSYYLKDGNVIQRIYNQLKETGPDILIFSTGLGRAVIGIET